jgi:RNA polymerase sigma factor (TIGR02999 family)
MSEVTRILEQIAQGKRVATEQLLPLVYDELQRLASMKLARENPGQTLQPTDLVHEAYLRLVDVEQAQRWENRRHFFAAAAEAMRRILIEAARRRKILPRVLLNSESAARAEDDRWFLLADALTTLAQSDPTAAQVAQLRLLGGLSIEEIGQQLGLSRATAYREWDFARAWLVDHLNDDLGKKTGEP